MATITLESFMPARCWIAPLMPIATYSWGATHLPVIGRVAGVHRCARGADGSAELVGQRHQDLHELLAGAQRPATGHDDLGSGQLRAIIFGDFTAHVS